MADAMEALEALPLEDGRRWGEVATPVQRADAAAVLDPNSASPFHLITRSRGYSKTTDIGAVALVTLLSQAPAGSKSYAVAADQAQARLLLDAVEGFVRRGNLTGLVEVQAWKVTCRRTGATLEALAADGAGIWGLRPYLVVADEVCQWGESGSPLRIWEAVTSAMPKTGGRLVVITTAGNPGHWAKRVRDHAETDPRWRLSETLGAPPWLDAGLLEEQQARLPESSYRRLFMNEWTEGEDALVSPEDLAACMVLDGAQEPRPGCRYIIGLDVGLKHDRTVAAVCHCEASIVQLDRMAVWQGTRLRPVKLSEVQAWIEHAAREYGARVVCDPWQSVQLAQQLRGKGVSVREYTFSPQSIGRLASSLFQSLREHTLQLPDDDELRDELLRVRLKETSPGLHRLDHSSGRHDDRAVALALAVHHLVERSEPVPMRVVKAHAPTLPTRTLDPGTSYADRVRAGLSRRTRAGLVATDTRPTQPLPPNTVAARVPDIATGNQNYVAERLAEAGIDIFAIATGVATPDTT